MNTPKSISGAPVQIGQDADAYGLRSDMLEPSSRYAPLVPVSVSRENTSETTTDETISLASLRLPRRHARTRVSDFLD
jgi:hypothetical protein